jgi:mRNA interferase MazF
MGPVQGGEQVGRRPVLLFEHDRFIPLHGTVIVVPLSGNLKRASWPTCVLLHAGQGGLANDSVALCHQLRVVDKGRLVHRLGVLPVKALSDVEKCVAVTLGI